LKSAIDSIKKASRRTLWPRTDDPSDWVVTDGRRADNLTVKNQRYAAFHLIEHPTDGI
jgi:hypothetical protein